MNIVIFIGTVNLLLLLTTYFYYRWHLPLAHGWSFGLVYAFLALNNIFSRTLPETLPPLLTKISAWLGGIWMAFAYYSLLWALLHLLIWAAGKMLGWHLSGSKIAAAGVILVTAFVAWGSYRAYTPVIRTERITTSKLPAGHEYKIAFLSDIHLGRILGRSYAETMTQRINKLHPDLVLIAGDILDEKQAYVLQEDSLAPLGSIEAPKGVYMAYGNHDYLDKPQLWQTRLEEQKINVLRDRSVIIDDQLKLTGLEDFRVSQNTKALECLAKDNDKYYSIIIDHQPRKILAASDSGYDLYLAGHTHTGQLFPNRMITRKMYLLDYGRATFGSLTAITNNGYGFWGAPIRTEQAPEIVVIQLIGTGN